MDVIVLVGGFGTRIRHIIGMMPKPMALIAGKPFLYWFFQNLKNRGVRNVYLLTHFGADIIENYVMSQEFENITIKCLREDSPLGTGGSVINFLSLQPQISDPFLLMNGDSLLKDYDLDGAINKIRKGCDGVIFGVPMKDSSRYGTLKIDNKMILTSFEEKKVGGGIINTGIYLLTTSLFTNLKKVTSPSSFEKEIVPSMIDNGAQIYVSIQQSPFIDIGTEECLNNAKSFIQDNLIHIDKGMEN